LAGEQVRNPGNWSNGWGPPHTAQHAYLTTTLGLLARVGVPERIDPALAQAALAEIRSPEVASALHELQELGERLRQHINRIDGPRHRPRRRTRA